MDVRLRGERPDMTAVAVVVVVVVVVVAVTVAVVVVVVVVVVPVCCHSHYSFRAYTCSGVGDRHSPVLHVFMWL